MGYLKLLGGLITSKRILKKSPMQLKEFQNSRLRKMLRYAYENSDYYRKTFAIAGITEKILTRRHFLNFRILTKNTYR